MNYIAYVTFISYHGNKLHDHRNTCYVELKTQMKEANVLIRYICASHTMVVIIHNSWNLDITLFLFYPDFLHMSLVIFIQS